MGMEIVQFDETLLGTGNLFPSNINSSGSLGFHATASYHSKAIETNGFVATSPFDRETVKILLKWGKKLEFDTYNVELFQQVSGLSFSPLSELCLKQIRPELIGGQGLQFFKQMVQLSHVDA